MSIQEGIILDTSADRIRTIIDRFILQIYPRLIHAKPSHHVTSSV